MPSLKPLLPCCLALVLAPPSALYGQGCSDAGVCTMGSLQQNGVADSAGGIRVILSVQYGAGEQGVSTVQAVPEVEIPFGDVATLQARMPVVYATGNLGNAGGAGDPVFSLTRRLWQRAHSALDVTAGMRIAAGRTGLEADGRPLPMPYQPGLGTHDLVFGLSVQHAGWHAGIGYQHVLDNRNRNAFTHAAWESDIDAAGYFESAGLDRQDDVMLRVERAFRHRSLGFTPGLLAIWHTGQDLIDAAGMATAVPGSDGLTLNVTLALEYAFGPRSMLVLKGGSPAVVRDNRPDGLTRSLVVTFGYAYRFNPSRP